MTKDIKDSGFNELLLKNESRDLKTFDDLASQDREAALLSNNRSFRIFDSGTVSLNKPGVSAMNPTGVGFASTTITHNLGFRPSFLAFVDIDNTNITYRPVPHNSFNLSVNDGITSKASVNKTEIQFTIEAEGGARAADLTYNFKYYLLRERN